jgi:putative DNA primase/helicase
MTKPTPLLRVLNALGDLNCKVTRDSKSAQCPAHEDKEPSLSITEKDDGQVLLHCQAGCPIEDVLAALHLSKADLFPPRAPTAKSEITATYDYTDAGGQVIFQVVRYAPKTFKQRRPDPAARSGWAWNLKDVPRVLYRLPEVLEAVATGRTIYVVEGEKDAGALVRAGQVATCNPGGAGKWRTEHADALAGAAEVIVVADADEPGRRHAHSVGASLAGRVDNLSIVEPAIGKDAADHLGAGRTVEEFVVSSDGEVAQETSHPGDKEVLPSPGNPMAVARVLLADRRHPETNARTLLHWRGSWMRWEGPIWTEMEERTVRSEVYHRVEEALFWHETRDGAELRDWAPNRHKLGDLLEAIAAQEHLPQGTQPPAWLNPGHGATGIVACTNGLLEVTTRTLQKHTPNYFNVICVPFDYDCDALEPTEWLAFLDQLWPDDPESVILLQQWFGYVISGATDLQKILGIIGPIRSGKGTICRVLRGLVGDRNVTAPTLSSFGQNFGLQDLIGKPVAIIGDVRLGGGEQHAVVERLLTISGEDTITIDRKYRDPWTGQLPTRIMFVSNELPRFGDASGAIATRCLILETRQSFLGQEDKALTARLLGELPAILNWALDGLKDLTELERFTEPPSSIDTVTALADLVSPISAFVRDCCLRGPLAAVETKRIYGAWRSWAEENGHKIDSAQGFGRNLRAVIPGLRITQPRDGDSRYRVYVGVGLRDQT